MENLITNMLNKALLEDEESLKILLSFLSNRTKEFILKGCPCHEEEVRKYIFHYYSGVSGVLDITPVLKGDNRKNLIIPYFKIRILRAGYMSREDFFSKRKSINDNVFETSSCMHYEKDEKYTILCYYVDEKICPAEDIIMFETK